MTNIKNNLNGWLVIDKPKGITSNGVIGRLKFLLHPQKIGHAGTLDPLATGVLPIALGKATRLIPFVMDDIKTYEFTIKWGIETDSDDLAGNEVASCDKCPRKEEILKIIPQFTGEITQTPSPYSAIKINGERAYDLARKGEQIKMPCRQVIIHQLKLIKNLKTEASFVATVSKGTYIRTLAHDIAHALGTVGVVSRLHRTLDGPFKIQEAISLEAINQDKIVPLDSVLGQLHQLEVSSEIARRIQQGQRIKNPDLLKNLPQETPILIQCEKRAVALAIVKKDVLHPECVLI